MLDTGAVTRGSGSKNDDKERNIRKWFVERDVIGGERPDSKAPGLRPIPHLEVGDRVTHDAFGLGTVIATRGAAVSFGEFGLKATEPERLVCSACGFVFYLDPKIAVAAVVAEYAAAKAAGQSGRLWGRTADRSRRACAR